MLMVAPKGSTKEETSLETPIFCAQLMVRGRVPPEEQELNAIRNAGEMPLKNWKTLVPATNFSRAPYTTTACTKQARYTAITTFSKGSSTAGPLAATTGVIRPNTPIGATDMM